MTDDSDKAERDYWTSWWEKATPEQREWARSVSGKSIRHDDPVSDDEGVPLGVTTTTGVMPNFAEMFPEEEDASR